MQNECRTNAAHGNLRPIVPQAVSLLVAPGSKTRPDGDREAKGTAVVATAVSPRHGSGLRLATAAT